MKTGILSVVFFAAFQVAAVGTKDCFAPKSVESECKKLTSDVVFQDYTVKQMQVLIDQKTNKPENVVLNASGKKVILFDEDKAYTIQVADVDQAAEGQILTLSIATRKSTGIPEQRLDSTKNLTFTLNQGKVTATRVETSFLTHILSEKAFESKSLKHNPITVASALMTSDFSGVKDTLQDGTEVISYVAGGLNIDTKTGYTLKSLTLGGTHKPTPVRQFTKLLGAKVQNAINDFVNRHVTVLQLRKEFNDCKTSMLIANCVGLEADVAAADMERDHQFLTMIEATDLKVRAAPALKPEPLPYVEVSGRCPRPPKTQFPNAIRYYYYYNLNGDCVAVSPAGPNRGG